MNPTQDQTVEPAGTEVKDGTERPYPEEVAEVPTGKMAIYAQVDPEGLRARARDLASRLAACRIALNNCQEALIVAQDRAEVERVRIVMSEAYKASGSNAEVRGAWLTQQRRDDPAYAEALSTLSSVRQAEEAVRSREESLQDQWKLALSEMRLAAAQLSFLAE